MLPKCLMNFLFNSKLDLPQIIVVGFWKDRLFDVGDR
jgi:hypothetical protein